MVNLKIAKALQKMLDLRRQLGVRIDKTNSEHNGSGYLPIADMRADIVLRASGQEQKVL